MAFNREQFASEVYLRLLESHPTKREEWLIEESIRRANAFAETLKEQQPKRTVQKRREVVNV